MPNASVEREAHGKGSLTHGRKHGKDGGCSPAKLREKQAPGRAGVSSTVSSVQLAAQRYRRVPKWALSDLLLLTPLALSLPRGELPAAIPS